MFTSNNTKLSNNKDFGEIIFNIIQKGSLNDIPNIEELCPACGTNINLSESHCFRCKGCFQNRFFHSNLFGICITKNNIKKYFIYLLLKINFYFICLYNCLERNETNQTILAFFYMIRFKTSPLNAFLEFIIGFFLFKEIGHLIALLLSLTVKTPYQYIYKAHKKIYPNRLKEKHPNKMVVQVPEINEYVPFLTGIKNIIKNIL